MCFEFATLLLITAIILTIAGKDLVLFGKNKTKKEAPKNDPTKS